MWLPELSVLSSTCVAEIDYCKWSTKNRKKPLHHRISASGSRTEVDLQFLCKLVFSGSAITSGRSSPANVLWFGSARGFVPGHVRWFEFRPARTSIVRVVFAEVFNIKSRSIPHGADPMVE